MSDFESRRQDWEKRMEDVIVEIVSEKDENGLMFSVDVMPAVREFNNLISKVVSARKAHKYLLRGGDKDAKY